MFTSLITVSCDVSLSNLRIRNNGTLRPTIALFICRSSVYLYLMDKAIVLCVTEKNFDFLLLNETWQTPNDYLHLNLLTPSGNSYLAKPHF